ncbi:DUF1385 domain-containing protein [Lentibacillus sediminis]|uniref:DUF1385 domain-containing protein n=1 Tax=Lentibacillus sediminis TaxID=1940529 RepID=UPI000C1C3192|nr:DUF1385 domain-containing protein [Lentibacillus sediminis]
MNIYGGRAGLNSVRFIGEKYQALARFKNGEITTETRRKKGTRKIFTTLSKIPFVRAFSLLFEFIIDYWKIYLVVFTGLLLMESSLIGSSNASFLHAIQINALVMLLSFFVIAGLFMKITPIAKYHAAEHMAASAYDEDPDLTLEKVKKQPRTHKNCGTNLVIPVSACFCILFFAFGDALWVFLVSWSIGYEIWRGEPKIIWGAVLAIGKVAQYYLFTSKPEEKHLMVAIEALRGLEEKENEN